MSFLFIFEHIRLREELEDIQSEHPDEPRDSKQNTSKFLALTLPASHNAGKRPTF